MHFNILQAAGIVQDKGAFPKPTAQIHKNFDDTLYYVYYNLAIKDSDKAFRVADSLYQSAKVPREQARSLMLMAGILGKKRDPISALNHIDKAIKTAKENNINDVLVWALYYKGELYRSLGFYQRGNAMLKEAENLIPKIKNEYWQHKFQATHSKGEAEMAMANYDFQKARDILLKATSDYKLWASTMPEAAAILGRCYQLLGDCYFNLNHLDKARETYHLANRYLDKWNTKNTIYTGRLYQGLGSIYLNKNILDSTDVYLQKALSIAEASNSNSFKNKVYKSLKEYYKKTNDSEQFTSYVKKQDSLASIIIRHDKSMINAMAEYPIIEKKEVSISSESGWTSNVIFITSVFIILTSTGVYFAVKKRNKPKQRDIVSKPKEVEINLSQKIEQELMRKLNKFESSNVFLDKEMSFSTLVGYLNTNEKYLRKILRLKDVTNYNNYINELRIKFIVQKLKTDPEYLNYKISYLAKESGFSSHSKFSSCFKQVLGETPSKFISKIKS
ncbi:helix-turn-helix domain-containing protein [Aequorivita marina]|uniref:helix-turn-helix domain-containing protein n=1 Tax=Aequorivita marina TaxID=3073654 RepID=UPI002876FD40|nr:helix-turn-helix domain-containing protein [Aequorivita sp. S2608]MDS1298660.1 helix-turn-helix domain-containing protein [Aequorivita sp. S2608]